MTTLGSRRLFAPPHRISRIVAAATGAGLAGRPAHLVARHCHANLGWRTSVLVSMVIAFSPLVTAAVRHRRRHLFSPPDGGRHLPDGRVHVGGRSDLNPARSSLLKSSGCSHAAKCPPLSSSLKRSEEHTS